MDSTPLRFSALRRAAAVALAVIALPAAALNHTFNVAPIRPGPFNVACSNLAHDASRLQPGVPVDDYWEGRNDRYLDSVLAAPQTALRFDALVPDDRSLYPGNAGDPVRFVAIVCHPTPRLNNDPSYTIPGTDAVIPHMQADGAAPKLINLTEYFETLVPNSSVDPAAFFTQPLPLIVYSHGLGGSPVGKGYIDVLVQLAAQGYMVAAVFHADSRFSRVKVQELSDWFYLLGNFERVAEMQLMRPVALKAMTDMLLAHPQFSRAIDPERIGGFGASLGGEAMALLMGARLTTSVGLRCSAPVRDPRIKAAVAFVPYAGYTFLPAFCDDQSGVEGVDRPFLAISGTADVTAPVGMMRQAIERFGHTRYLVEMQGGQHELRAEDIGDLFTWMVTFLNAYGIGFDQTAMATFIRMKGVTGGYSDTLVHDVHIPFPDQNGELRQLEFYNEKLDHFFITGGPGEIENILAGGAGEGWRLTGQAFKGWPQMPPDTFVAVSPVCRFYGAGPNSHFYTPSFPECELVKRDTGWAYEGVGFYIRGAPANQRCPDGYLAVNRAYNQGFARNDSNHRYSTSDSTMREMERLGWVYEGVAMCSRP